MMLKQNMTNSLLEMDPLAYLGGAVVADAPSRARKQIWGLI